MNKIIIALIVIIVAIGGWFVLSRPSAAPGEQTPTTTENNQTENAADNTTDIKVEVSTNKTHEVMHTDAGFSPANLTVKVGDTVTFKNQSSADMWVASAMHPTHSVYNGTTLQQHCPDPENNDFDQCQSGGAGTSWSFTFTKAGSFGYHNHVKAGVFGKIIVE